MGHMTQTTTTVDGTASVLIEEQVDKDTKERTLIITVKDDRGEYVQISKITANDLDIYNLHL